MKIVHFEIFKNFMEILKYSRLIVYEVSRKYIMLFIHNILTFNWFTYYVAVNYIQPAPIVHREIFEIFQKYFQKYFVKYFMPKNFMKFYITNCNWLHCSHTYVVCLIFTFRSLMSLPSSLASISCVFCDDWGALKKISMVKN